MATLQRLSILVHVGPRLVHDKAGTWTAAKHDYKGFFGIWSMLVHV